MLSILIPTYNYNVVPLVLEIQKQADSIGMDYEILVQDDFSQKFIRENSSINSLTNCNFFINTQNLGRGKNINFLAEKSKYNWLLIMDCDTFPKQKSFIEKYLIQIKESQKIVFGGIEYQEEKPNQKQLLRWVYGKARESLSVDNRNADPNGNALTSNLLVEKEIFTLNKFEDYITKYGYEDLIFLRNLKKKGITVKHINNPTYHLGIETSEQFLEKTKIALENLKSITKIYNLESSESKILRTYIFFKKIYLTSIITFLFKKAEKKIEQNLLSNNPSLVLFDLYKLGYYSKFNSI